MLVFFLVIYVEKVSRAKRVLIVAFFCLFLLNVLINSNGHNLILIAWGAKLLLPLLTFLFLKKYANHNYLSLHWTFITIIIVQSLAILVGFIFNINSLRTYGVNRFGFSGFIYLANEASLFILSSFFFILNQFHLYKKNITLIFLLLIIISSFLIGTKVGIVLSFIFLFILFFSDLPSKLKIYLQIGFLSIIIILIYLLITFDIINFFVKLSGEMGLWSSITSLRNVLFENKLNSFIDNFSISNLLLGGSSKFVEMDFFDLIFFAGILGAVLYYWALFEVIFKSIPENSFFYIFIFLFLIFGWISGHFFASGVNSMYLALLFHSFTLNPRIPEQQHI